MALSAPTTAPSAPMSDGVAPKDPILEIKNLHTYFFTERGVVRAVNGRLEQI